jgi:hypothetical protein
MAWSLFTDINAYSALDLSKVSFKEGKYAKGTSDCIQYITSKLGIKHLKIKFWLKQNKIKKIKSMHHLLRHSKVSN